MNLQIGLIFFKLVKNLKLVNIYDSEVLANFYIIFIS
jgi:hypothetical protein